MKLISTYFKLNNIKENNFTDHYLSHPNYPSLFSITDTLTLLNIDNVAVNVPKDQFDQLPKSFLTYITNNEKNTDLVLVQKKEAHVLYTSEKQIKYVETIEAFKEKWNGVIIVIEKNEKDKNISTNKNNLNKYWILFAIALSLFSFNFIYYSFSFIVLLSFFISATGLIISMLIINESRDKYNENISKLCSFSENTSCNSVIKSEVGKINNWLSYSDLPLLFFSTSVLSIIIDHNNSYFIQFISLLSLPIIIYTFWLQKVTIKKWCSLCIISAGLFFLQAILFLIVYPQSIYITDYLNTIVLFIISSFTWFFIKPIIEKNTKIQEYNLQLIRFKRNFKVFQFLEKEVVDPFQLNNFSKIKIGNKDTTVSLTLILSPSCGHCHKAFSDGLQLIKSTGEKVKLNILFNLNPENTDNPYVEIIKNLIQINKHNTTDAIKAVEDWHLEKMTLEKWLQKWKQENIEDWVESEILSQYNWCLENGFNYTPVKLINTKTLPQEYSIDEIKYFLTELEEEIKPLVLV